MSIDTRWESTRGRLASAGIAGLFLVPFVLFLYNVVHYATDVPIFDDNAVFLSFLNSWLRSANVLAKLGLVVAQQNEHRVAFLRIVALADYYLAGRLSFSTLTIFGTLGWIASIVILCLVLVRYHYLTFRELLPIPFTLLIYTQFNNMFMATTSLTFYWSILFAILFLVCLAEDRIVAACLFLLLALYTNGDGVVLMPVGLLYLIVKRRWRDAGIHAAWSAILAIAYFYRYTSATNLSIGDAFRHAGPVLAFSVAFLGNVLPSAGTALVLGAVIGVALLFFMVRRPQDSFLFLEAAWLLATAGLAAVTRYGFGLDMAVSSRYAQYGLLAAVLAYTWIMVAVRENPVGLVRPTAIAIVGTCFAIGLFAWSTYKYESNALFVRMRQQKIAGLSLLAAGGGSGGLVTYDQFKPHMAETLFASRDLGVFEYGEVLRSRLPVQSDPGLPANSSYIGNIETFDGLHISGWALIPGLDTKSQSILIVLKGGDHNVALMPIRMLRPDVSSVYHQPLYSYSGYDAYLGAYAVPPGTYELGILVLNRDQVALNWTGKEYQAP